MRDQVLYFPPTGSGYFENLALDLNRRLFGQGSLSVSFCAEGLVSVNNDQTTLPTLSYECPIILQHDTYIHNLHTTDKTVKNEKKQIMVIELHMFRQLITK